MATGLESAFSGKHLSQHSLGIAEIYNGFWWIEDSNGEVIIARISYGDLSVEEMTGIDGGMVRKPMTPIVYRSIDAVSRLHFHHRRFHFPIFHP